MRYLLSTFLVLISVGPASAFFFHEAPLTELFPDSAVFLIHDPTAPELATYKKDRTVSIGTLKQLLLTTGGVKITVGTTAPTNPSVGDLWVDTSVPIVTITYLLDGISGAQLYDNVSGALLITQ